MLRLDVYPVDAVDPMVVHSIVTNASDRPVTIPTSTYTGGVSGWAQGSGNLGIFFIVGLNSVGEKSLVPSPVRFFPVTLQPGESTELPLVHARREGEKTVEVTFVVEKDFAQNHGWWFGRLKKKVVIGEGENPYIEPLESSDVGEFPGKPEPNKPLHGTPAKAPSSSTESEGRRP